LGGLWAIVQSAIYRGTSSTPHSRFTLGDIGRVVSVPKVATNAQTDTYGRD
jgi:hypothetical protein